MPVFKGETTIKLDKEAKAGEELKLNGVEVDVPQAEIDKLVTARITRERETVTDKVTKELTAKYEAELAEAKKGAAAAPADNKLAKQVEELTGKLAQADLDKAVDAEIKAQGGTLDGAYRARIAVKPGATPEEIKASVTAAVAEQDAFLKANGLDPKTKKIEEKIGFTGTGGSLDTNAQLESQTLENKLRANRPDLKQLIEGVTPERKLALLKEYEAKGLLAPRGQKK